MNLLHAQRLFWLLAALLLGSCTSLEQTTAQPTARPQATARPQVSASGLPLATLDKLPPEAAETLELVIDGGPFPYQRDGLTFQNREGLLPREPRGYYREYTVPTPGENDRGARRLVVGEGGEVYYTGDHYESFVEVAP